MTGETLECKHDTREEARLYNDYVVRVYKSEEDKLNLVGHVPIDILWQLPFGIFSNGLVMRTFKATCNDRRTINILKVELDNKVPKLSHMWRVRTWFRCDNCITDTFVDIKIALHYIVCSVSPITLDR